MFCLALSLPCDTDFGFADFVETFVCLWGQLIILHLTTSINGQWSIKLVYSPNHFDEERLAEIDSSRHTSRKVGIGNNKLTCHLIGNNGVRGIKTCRKHELINEGRLKAYEKVISPYSSWRVNGRDYIKEILWTQ